MPGLPTTPCALDKESDLGNICFTLRAIKLARHLSKCFTTYLNIFKMHIYYSNFTAKGTEAQQGQQCVIDATRIHTQVRVCRPLTANQFYLTDYKKC